jgi:putative spermidine/putrescine transport system substrate-binding protein
MTTSIKRRDFVIGGGALSVAAALRHPAYAEETTLRVTHFGGPYQVLESIVGKPFEAATKTKVVYYVEISPTIYPKLQSQKSDPPFDVVMFSRPWALRASKGGLVAKLSASDFPDTSHFMKDVVAPGGWGVAMVLDTMDIMVDKKQVEKPLDSWLDLWRPDLKGKILLPSATEGATCFAFLLSLVKAVGGDIKSQAAVDETFKRLESLKSNVRSFYSDGTQPNMLIERGDIAVAPQFAIRIANTTRRNPNVAKVSPKEGMVAIPYDLCIPTNVKNVAQAKAYMNFTLTKPIQTELASKLLATPVRTDVTVTPDVAPLINADPKLVWFADAEYAASKEREWLDRYTRQVQS